MDHGSTDSEQRWQALFERAMVARDAGRLDKALALLRFIRPKLGASSVRLALYCELQLSYISKLRGDNVARLEHAERAAALSPTDELASMNLFHSLLAFDRRLDAMRECVRFVTDSDSPAYRELLSKGFSLDLPPAELELAVEARRLLRRHEGSA